VINGENATYMYLKVDTNALTKNTTYLINARFCDQAGNCGNSPRNFLFQ
jgi:hypothetical protein